MATQTPFPHAGFLSQLELLADSAPAAAVASLSPSLSRLLLTSDETRPLTEAAGWLIQLLKAQQARLQAAFDTELAADELRRYQKFAKPGQPSPHIVQLRQKQAAARQASNISKQSFLKAAAAFVREAGIEIPPRVTLEDFITGWIDTNVPKTSAAAN
ncbi:hypothetical protein SAMN05216570_3464 [Dyella sp. OK004]|uniref:hypothetical protein n=1 Tax=Dyella sp. OK004 TaxID=1855292 RepID=UPI0008DFAD15|nr:hypothetical protein [Dyella sp. OK004]SFS17087.1 hypothetical protein SAMN05216570_3464 [Dyella sp. OK004]